jgi:hypothetical protein
MWITITSVARLAQAAKPGSDFGAGMAMYSRPRSPLDASAGQ